MIRDSGELPVVPLIISLLSGQPLWGFGGDETILPIEDHDVCRIEYTEETNTINDLLRQNKVEVLASKFALGQRRAHCERHNAY